MFVATVLLATACSKDGLDNENNNGDNLAVSTATGNITFTSSGIGKRTRTALHDDGVTVKWQVGDQVTVAMCPAAGGSYLSKIYTVSQVDAQGVATFTGELSWPAADTEYTFYAYHKGGDFVDGETVFDCKGAVHTGTGVSHLGTVDALVASPVVVRSPEIVSGNISPLAVPLTFYHIFPVIELRLAAFGTGDMTVSKIEISNNTTEISATGISVDLRLDALHGGVGKLGTMSDRTKSLALNFSGAAVPTLPSTGDPGLTTSHLDPAGNTVWATHIAILPGDYTGTKFTVTITTNKGDFTFTKPGANFVAGGKYVSTFVLNPSAALVKITAGTFLMGSSDGSNIGNGNGSGLNTTPAEPGRKPNETQHQVTLTKDFYMSKYQVTNLQYAAFLNAEAIGSDGKWATGTYPTQQLISASSGYYDWGLHYNADKWEPVAGYENHPVIFVTWFGATEYARWVGGNLPTEAQWEYACRAGTTTAFSFGDDDADMGRYGWPWENNTADGTKAVGRKQPNAWGLYDMHGNVFEWCSDWHDSVGSGSVSDPIGPATGSGRVVRGGSYAGPAQLCRSAFRPYGYPYEVSSDMGFRVVFVP